ALALALLCFMTAGQMPIGESMAIRQVQGDPGGYGRIRIWGSSGYILTVLGGGAILDALGLDAWPWVMAASLVGLLGVTLMMRDTPTTPIGVANPATGKLPDQAADQVPDQLQDQVPDQTREGEQNTPQRSDESLSTALQRAPVVSMAARLSEPAVMAFLASVFCMIFAHGALYGFWSIYLERHGYTRFEIGMIWALGVVAEILLFALQRRLFQQFPAVSLLLFSFWIAALRFALIALTDAQAWVVVTTSLMHAVTFGVHHSASMALLHRLFPASQQGRAQAAFIVVGYGLGAGLGGIVAGMLWESWSPAATWWGASLASVLGVLALRMHTRRTASTGDTIHG
ncbi:MAG: MFS transporter, partial [Burkholderiaceae bacterium]